MEKNRKKKIITLLVIVFVTTLSIAFAAVSRTININGTAKMDTALWDVHFENLSDARIIRDAQEVNKPYISDDGIMIYDMDVKLTKPKDEIIYTVEIVNSGTIDAEIESIEVPVLTEQQEKLIDFIAVYNDGTSITEKDFLKAGESDLITISIKYSNDITEFDLPDAPLTINLTFKINYIQSDGLTNENSGKTEVKSVLTTATYNSPASSTFLGGSITKESVESVDFISTMYVPNDALGSWDASHYKNGSVIAWYQDIDKNGLYEVYFGGNGKIYASSGNCLFFYFLNLKEVNFNNNFDTSEVTDMTWMFRLCPSLTSLDLSGFNTSKVKTMSGLFDGCSSMNSVVLSSFNTSNVTIMSSMFSECSNLKELNVSNFNTSNVTTMERMFKRCNKLVELELSNFDTGKVTNMGYMFHECGSLTELNVSNFNTSNVTSMFNMFSGCSSLTTLDLSSFDTSKVQTMQSMFYPMGSITELKFNKVNLSGLTGYWYCFNGLYNVMYLDISEASTEVYSNEYFPNLINAVKKGATIYVLNEECVTLGQTIRSDVNFVVKEA